jgi:HAD superfamily hydrolase (TIGR01509 family)
MPLRGLLLDSGGVLVRPRGGRWNPRHDFESVMARLAPHISLERFDDAVAAGERHMDDEGATPTRDAYHRAVLEPLGLADPPQSLLDALNAPLDIPPLEPYPDVLPALTALHARGVPMVVVSDNWGDATGMRAMFDKLGIGRFFEGFVVSEELGCRKPDPRMYDAGGAILGLPRQDLLFVDDGPELVEAAIALGYQGLVMDRDGGAPGAIRELGDLLARFG